MSRRKLEKRTTSKWEALATGGPSGFRPTDRVIRTAFYVPRICDATFDGRAFRRCDRTSARTSYRHRQFFCSDGEPSPSPSPYPQQRATAPTGSAAVSPAQQGRGARQADDGRRGNSRRPRGTAARSTSASSIAAPSRRRYRALGLEQGYRSGLPTVAVSLQWDIRRSSGGRRGGGAGREVGRGSGEQHETGTRSRRHPDLRRCRGPDFAGRSKCFHGRGWWRRNAAHGRQRTVETFTVAARATR